MCAPQRESREAILFGDTDAFSAKWNSQVSDMTIKVNEIESNIVCVTIDDAGTRNALDEVSFRQLAALWPQLDSSNCRAVIVTGANNAFSSGANLAANLTALPDIDDLVAAALMKEQGIRKPVIAAIDGACVAGGFELALACDIRLCSHEACFGLPEVRWGIFPSGGGARRLAAEIGYSAAAELLLTGRLFGPEEARALGLINRVVSREQLMQEALAKARAITANSPVAVQAVKSYVARARNVAPDLACMEARLTQSVRSSEDAAEGRRAFLAKESPRYSSGH